jgi:hypothetical protein
MLKSAAIKAMLHRHSHPDLADMYQPGMEVQVNVAQDGGERVEGEYKGRQWAGWTDASGQVWKPFRIPRNAMTEPESNDNELRWDIEAHAEGIGMTGWDWQARQSKWVGFDFDSLIGHNKGLTENELQEIREAVTAVPWVTVRYSTSGRGLHLYVYLAGVPTANHHEHAAVARAILGKLAAVTGYDLQSKVDGCGGNLWVWHRKMRGTKGLQLIRQGDTLSEVPDNWRDHLTVVRGQRKKAVPGFIDNSQRDDVESLFEELSGQRNHIPLDEEHKKLIHYLEENGASWWWDADHHMLVCHTFDLLQAHEAMGARGLFTTMSTGKEKGQDHNAFAYPMRKGGWSIRRYTPGCQETSTWEQDGAGWTCCTFNVLPDLKQAARAHSGIEVENGEFVFREAENAQKAALMLGADLALPPSLLSGRETRLKRHKDGRLVAKLEWNANDPVDKMGGWLVDKKRWQKIFNVKTENPKEAETGNYDDILRHLVSEGGEDLGWAIKDESGWRLEPLVHVRAFLDSLGLSPQEVKRVIGSCVSRAWRIVNRPFEPEYVGDRCWNRKAVQFRFTPTAERDALSFPTWSQILNHLGKGIDEAVKLHPWCRTNGITSGADYIKCWIASLFQQPREPLPYLFLYSETQSTGKSTLHEALSLLTTGGGVVRADQALTNPNTFNGELAHAILCVIEEVDLGRNKTAYNRVKDWVTSREISIHKKGETPYLTWNTSHWIHTANDRNHCPVFSGDTRITYIRVNELELTERIPRKELIPRLEKEAPDFLAEIMSVELPTPEDRLNVPVIETDEKLMVARSNQGFLDMFLDEMCYPVTGEWIKFSELCEAFHNWLEPDQREKWSKVRIGRELPRQYLKGRSRKDGQFYVGNVSWTPCDGEPKPAYARDGDYLDIKEA